MSIIFAPLDDPAREHGLTLHKVGRVRRGHTPPTPMLQVSGSDDEDALDKALSAEPPVYTKAMKRASSISILSGLGVNLEKSSATAGGANQEGPSSPTSAVNSASPTKTFRKGPSKLRNFFGQRPPSELITNHLQEYFPFTEKRVLERTRRQSIMRQSGLPGRRDSIISFNMNLPSQSRFSVSTIGSQRTTSTSARMSTASSASASASLSATAVDRVSPEPSLLSGGSTLYDPPRVSLSMDDGRSIDLSNETTPKQPQGGVSTISPHLLPPVAFPSESLSESLNLSDSQSASSVRSSRRMSTASKRMSYITELRSKRDRSDTASLMTVDEITAEVESRQETAAKSGDSDEWTKVDVPDDRQSAQDEDEGDEEEEDEEEYDEEEEEEGEEGVPTDEDEGTGQRIESKGRFPLSVWRVGLVADLTCMATSQARGQSSGSKGPSSAQAHLGRCILEWTPRLACSWR